MISCDGARFPSATVRLNPKRLASIWRDSAKQIVVVLSFLGAWPGSASAEEPQSGERVHRALDQKGRARLT